MRWKDYEKGWWSKLEGKTVPQRGTNACPLMSAILWLSLYSEDSPLQLYLWIRMISRLQYALLNFVRKARSNYSCNHITLLNDIVTLHSYSEEQGRLTSVTMTVSPMKSAYFFDSLSFASGFSRSLNPTLMLKTIPFSTRQSDLAEMRSVLSRNSIPIAKLQ